MTSGQLRAEIAAILSALTGVEQIAPDATLEGDLGLDSLDVADLAARLRERNGFDLMGYLAALDVDRLVDLTVAELAAVVA
ncbi:MAG TPA: acyl carrier protein [Pseudonocardiaceae bacterium]|nr:acyl carrier protein [Pseudonocardiaceae bacterium]